LDSYEFLVDESSDEEEFSTDEEWSGSSECSKSVGYCFVVRTSAS